MKINTLNEIYDRKNNSFDDIRFVLASLVLFGHSYALLYGEGGQKDFITLMFNYQLGSGSFAVYMFFILSGFFMIQSLEANPSIINYSKSRILRIIPAFWLSLGLFSFIVIPIIFNSVNIFDFKDGSSLYFFIKSATFHLFGYSWIIDGAFPNNIIAGGINGSMWTLKHEIALYFILPIIVWFTYNKRNLLLMFFLFFLVLALLNITSEIKLFNIPCCKAWILGSNEYSSFVVFSAYFFSGVVIYKYKDLIIISKRYIIACIVLIVLGILYSKLKIILLFTLPYLIIVFGSIFTKRLFSKTGDYSYGMYIYAFPIQQVLIHFFKNELNAEILFISSFIVTLIFSIISWHFFEKKILRWKNNVKKENIIIKERKYEHI